METKNEKDRRRKKEIKEFIGMFLMSIILIFLLWICSVIFLSI